ncbi:maltotransferase domain-containing protein, partial [Streptomyces sp. NPDC058470]|uniref:maltotransferase domain-containing protein n=1 Tax=Streptomyces sp. NPDC058470 TaxID=3346515 RepID=UPI00365F9F52
MPATHRTSPPPTSTSDTPSIGKADAGHRTPEKPSAEAEAEIGTKTGTGTGSRAAATPETEGTSAPVAPARTTETAVASVPSTTSVTPPAGITATATAIGRIPLLDVHPIVDHGRWPAKAVAGEAFEVSATVFREGHDAVAANVVLRDPEGRTGPWTPMRELAPGTDRWGATVSAGKEGHWTYAVEAWGDPISTWRRHAGIKIPAGIDTELVLEEGARLYERAATGVPKSKGRRDTLRTAAAALRDVERPASARLAAALTPEVDRILARHPLRELVTSSEPLPLKVERERALYGSWYEFFPRSEGTPERPHGTFRTAAERLPAIARMGFDVVYLPPIHPIGGTFRKGPNNTLSATPEDVGVPWAIGSPEGGHDAVHPDLGTIDD